MNQFEQLEKYKELLDQKVISEEEFLKIKQKILGLKAGEEEKVQEQKERSEALAQIDKMRAEEARGEVQTFAADEKSWIEKPQETAKQEALWERQQAEKDMLNSPAGIHEKIQNTYMAEKAKERARLEALEEFEEKERLEQREKVKKVTKALTNILLWVISVILLIVAIASITDFSSVQYTVTGIIAFIIAIAACPFITEKTRNIEKLKGYYQHKKLIVTLLVIAYFVAILVIPA